LPQAILSGGIALTEIKILVVLRLDVRDATLVTPYRDAIFNTFDLNCGLLRSGPARVKREHETKKDEKEDC
jgi:hypothetical protein